MNWSSTENKSEPLFANSAAPIKIASPVRNSFSVKGLH